MQTALSYQQTKFLKSAVKLSQLPADDGVEVAFIGRSNAGKSSALNTITGLKGLARTSKCPGRTQCINLFTVDKDYRMVDLPGYGYAKVPLSIKKRWEETVDKYLQNRHCLRGLVLVMDIRHPLKSMDLQLIEWTTACKIPTHVLLTKADKLSQSQAKQTLLEVKKALERFSELVTVQLFSALERVGLEEARDHLEAWFAGDASSH